MNYINNFSGGLVTDYPDIPNYPCIRSSEDDSVSFVLEKVTYKAQIGQTGAEVRIIHTFTNSLTTSLEAVYVYPLPPRAIIQSVVAKIGDRVVKSKLKERSNARETYQNAINEGRTASLLEAERDDIFTLTLGRIQPGARIDIVTKVTVPLFFDSGVVSLLLPTVVGQRYVPGKYADEYPLGTDQVPDASRITPPRLTKGSIPVDFEARFYGDVSDIKLVSHPDVIIKKPGKNSLLMKNLEADRDLVLSWVGKTSDKAVWVEDYKDSKRGTLEVVYTPVFGERKLVDLAILIDHSGSMGGWKMSAAKEAAATLICALTKKDKVWLGWFDHTLNISKSCQYEMVNATEFTKAQLVADTKNISADGGTEIVGALQVAAAALGVKSDTRDKVILLITDGQVGNEAAMRALSQTTLANVRIITVAIDAVSAGGALEALGGHIQYVPNANLLDEVLLRINRRIVKTAGIGLRLRSTNLDVSKNTPERVDAYTGSTVRLYARCNRPTEDVVSIHSDDLGVIARVPVMLEKDKGVISRYGDKVLHALLSKWAMEPRSNLVEKITKLSLQYKILTPFTAFVAVDKKGTPVPGFYQTLVQPVSSGFGWQGAASAHLLAGPPPGALAMFAGPVFKNSVVPAPAAYAPPSNDINAFTVHASLGISIEPDSLVASEPSSVLSPSLRNLVKALLSNLKVATEFTAKLRKEIGVVLDALRGEKVAFDITKQITICLDKYEDSELNFEQLCYELERLLEDLD